MRTFRSAAALFPAADIPVEMVLVVAVGIRAQHHVEIGAGGTADLTQVTPCAAAGTELLGHRQFRAVAQHEAPDVDGAAMRSEEHTSELQSLMRISYAVFCL